MADARFTMTVASALVAGAIGCGGASDGLVDAASLTAHVAGPTESGDAGRFLSALVDVFDHETCAVRVIVGTRTVLYDERTEAQIAWLSEMAHDMCTAGVHAVSAGYDELGEPEITLGDRGRARGDGVTFAVATAQPWTFEGNAWTEVGRSTCGGTLPAQRDHTVRILDDGFLVVEVEGDGVFPVAIERDSGVEICPTRIQAEPAGVVWLNGPGEWDVYVASSDGARGAWDARVSTPDDVEGHSNGTTGFIEQTVQVGPYTREAWTDFGCTGYIGWAPTLTYWLPASVSLDVEVDGDANSDPVLVLVGPNGQVRCNDDFDGLDPALYGVEGEGTWEIYLGTYGSNETFSAALRIMPR